VLLSLLGYLTLDRRRSDRSGGQTRVRRISLVVSRGAVDG
jgi:hypothetical protein